LKLNAQCKKPAYRCKKLLTVLKTCGGKGEKGVPTAAGGRGESPSPESGLPGPSIAGK